MYLYASDCSTAIDASTGTTNTETVQGDNNTGSTVNYRVYVYVYSGTASDCNGYDMTLSLTPTNAVLLASDPAMDGTLPKTQNNVILLTFDRPIVLPGGPALSIESLPLPGAEVGGSFTYTLSSSTVLKAKENGPVLTNQTWYRVTPAAGLNANAFERDFCTLQGDGDNGGRVLVADYFQVKVRMGMATDARYDLDGSGQVLVPDYFVVKNHMGNSKPAKP
jgi:hypothetical protein